MPLQLLLLLHVAGSLFAATAELDHQACQQKLVVVVPVFSSLRNLAHKLLLCLSFVHRLEQLRIVCIVFVEGFVYLFLVWLRPVEVADERVLHPEFLEAAKQEFHGVENHCLETANYTKHEIERVDRVGDRVGHAGLRVLDLNVRGVATVPV